MRALTALVAVTVLSVSPSAAADPLAEARRLYNLEQYDTAVRYAREAMKLPATLENGRLVLGRIHLERFRRTADPADLTEAREALKTVKAETLDAPERAELGIGLGECLFLEERYGAASEAFERVLDASAGLGPIAHERVLDWWATALDRLAISHPRDARAPIHRRVVERMERELSDDPSSAPAAYWLTAGLRGTGNLDRAWHAAMAGWVGGALGRDHGAALRADLDRLMIQGIIPERASRLQPKAPQQAATSMLSEWEAFKTAWTR